MAKTPSPGGGRGAGEGLNQLSPCLVKSSSKPDSRETGRERSHFCSAFGLDIVGPPRQQDGQTDSNQVLPRQLGSSLGERETRQILCANRQGPAC